MAVAPTGAIYKALEFDGESSASYGVYITGQAVYNAPVRDVEMITIPNRNGAFALDNGRFENVTITYPAGIFADAEIDFAKAISDFRNFLCSKKGYVRLTDDYNPSEYRMAIYKSGLEVEPALLKAGEFSITFDCKPQRYLLTGESEISLTSGDTVLNPTLFDAQPLIMAEGYGTIVANGHAIEIDQVVMGDITIDEFDNTEFITSAGITIPSGHLNTGDTFSLNGLFFRWTTNTGSGTTYQFQAVPSISHTQTGVTSEWLILPYKIPSSHTVIKRSYYRVQFNFPSIEFAYGTSGTYQNQTTISGTTKTKSGSQTATISTVYTTDVVYDATTQTITVNVSASSTVQNNKYVAENTPSNVYATSISGDSTVSVLGHPTYIDCEIGEAYKLVNDKPVSLNQYIDIGSDLPYLHTGSNIITFDNTITEVKVVPRWWKV